MELKKEPESDKNEKEKENEKEITIDIGKELGENEKETEIKYHQGLPEKQFNENLDYLSTHPLFMKNLPENVTNNPELSGIQNIIYNDTPENIAKHFNELGNSYIKKECEFKYYIKEAMKFYNEGLKQNCKDNVLNSKLYSNKALINLKFKNYREVTNDCLKAIELNPQFIKPYFRCAKAFLYLEQYKESIDICEKGLKIEEKNEEILQVKEEAQSKYNAIIEKQAKKSQSLIDNNRTLIKACQDRGIVLGKFSSNLPEMYKNPIRIENDHLFTSIIVFYPEFKQLDFIEKADVGTFLVDHLNLLIKDGLP